jgi:hypothetical protein
MQGVQGVVVKHILYARQDTEVVYDIPRPDDRALNSIITPWLWQALERELSGGRGL